MCKAPIIQPEDLESFHKIYDFSKPKDSLEEQSRDLEHLTSFLSTGKCDSEKMRRETREIRESI